MEPGLLECLASIGSETVEKVNVGAEAGRPAPVWKFLAALALVFAAPLCGQIGGQPGNAARIVGGVPIDLSAPPLPAPEETAVTKTLQFPNVVLPAASVQQAVIGQQVFSWLLANPRWTTLDSLPPLRQDYVSVVPGLGGIADSAYVRLIQTANGLDVVGSQVVITLSLSPTGNRIESLEAILFPEVSTPATAGGMTAEQSVAQAAQRVGSDLSGSTIQPLGLRVRWLNGAWRVVQEFAVHGADVNVAVDVATGQTRVWEARHHETYSGKIEGRLVLFNPQTTTILNTVPLPHLYLSDGAASSTYTTASGSFTLTTPSTANLPISLTGSWGTVNDENMTPLGATIVSGTPNPITLVFNPTGSVDTSTAQTSAYYHEAFIHDWIASIGVEPAGIDTVLPIYVNWPETCDSFYFDRSINFDLAGNGCINSAYDTLIYHEYGHFIDDVIGGLTNDALSEGWGDILATFASGQSLMGEGFYAGQPNSFIRNASNSYQYNPADEAHKQGQSWMGFAWDLRQSLIASLGQNVGVAIADSLVLPVYFNNSPDIPSAVRAVAVRDGLSGQTPGPHYGLILAAAGNHGLAFALNIAPPHVTITSPASGATISGTFTVAGTATGIGVVTSVFLELDGTRLGTATGTTGWTFLLNTATIPAGTHTLTAVATDGQGYQGICSIQITIAPSLKTAFVTSISGAAPIGTPPSWAGMEIQVGASPLTVTALGRAYVAGNNQTHMLKLVDAVTGIDLPNASVSVTMAPPPFSSFVYGDLPAPVMLSAGRIYYVVSQEMAGVDFLLDSSTRVQTTSVASVLGPASYRRSWSVPSAPNNTWGPVDFLYQTQTVSGLPVITSPATATAAVGSSFTYTITATNNPVSFNATGLPSGLTLNATSGIISGAPQTAGTFAVTLAAANSFGAGTLGFMLIVSPAVPTASPTAFVVSFTPSTLVAIPPAWAGMEIQVGASPITVTALGRIFLPGNNQTHTLKLVDAVTGNDVPNSTAIVAMTPPASSAFVYGNTLAPVTLNPGRVYYVLSQEFSDGDSLYDSTTVIQTTAAASVLGPASYRRGWAAVPIRGEGYGPLDFICHVASNSGQ